MASYADFACGANDTSGKKLLCRMRRGHLDPGYRLHGSVYAPAHKDKVSDNSAEDEPTWSLKCWRETAYLALISEIACDSTAWISPAMAPSSSSACSERGDLGWDSCSNCLDAAQRTLAGGFVPSADPVVAIDSHSCPSSYDFHRLGGRSVPTSNSAFHSTKSPRSAADSSHLGAEKLSVCGTWLCGCHRRMAGGAAAAAAAESEV